MKRSFQNGDRQRQRRPSCLPVAAQASWLRRSSGSQLVFAQRIARTRIRYCRAELLRSSVLQADVLLAAGGLLGSGLFGTRI